MRHKPTFIHIGVARSGSTWLHRVFEQHPDIYVPPGKDTLYFLNPENKSLAWYLSFFSADNKASARGEICHRYFGSPKAAQNIAKDFPDIQILCCLREPGDRTRSAHLYDRSLGLKVPENFADYAQLETTCIQNNYYQNLRVYFDSFPRENILVSFYDDLVSSPHAYLERILKFLRVTPHLESMIKAKVWEGRYPRWPMVTHFGYQFSQKLRHLGYFNLVGHIKKSAIADYLLFNSRQRFSRISDMGALESFRKNWHGENHQLETLIGRPLPKTWLTPGHEQILKRPQFAPREMEI